MTPEQYNAFAEQIRAGRVVHANGRSAATLAELDFLRGVPELPPITGVVEIDHSRAPGDALLPTVPLSVLPEGLLPDTPGEASAAFTPEYVAETSFPGTSATEINPESEQPAGEPGASPGPEAAAAPFTPELVAETSPAGESATEITAGPGEEPPAPEAELALTREGLLALNRDVLEERAKAAGITGYSALRKEELVDALLGAG